MYIYIRCTYTYMCIYILLFPFVNRYKRLLLKESSLLQQLETDHENLSGSGTDWKKLQSLLMQLRKCCNHPFLFPDVEPADGEDYAEQLVSGSGKIALLQVHKIN